MKKIVVIGGGASGLVAAIYAAKHGSKVILIEKNRSCCKKILITGNGKCNYFNSDLNVNYYYSTHLEILENIITNENKKEILSFFDSVGIIPRIKNTYYYPFSNQATSIKEALLLQANLYSVKIRNDISIEEIVKKDSCFILNPLKENIQADKVILATGSKAFPKTGSDGSGYKLASAMGHSIIDVLPALVPLKGDESYFKLWTGIRCDAKITLYENNQIIKEEQGEVQLTDYGISGICAFNLSSFVVSGLSHMKKMTISIDFLDGLVQKNTNKRIKWLNERNNKVQNRTIEQLLEGILHYQLISIILKKCHITLTKHWENFTDVEKNLLIDTISNFSFDVTGAKSFDSAQVCTGGIPLCEINPLTMESLKVKGLYLVGELLDVNGECGGYNLGFAWISGMIAGIAVSKNL